MTVACERLPYRSIRMSLDATIENINSYLAQKISNASQLRQAGHLEVVV
jgi:hypothetical protein